MISERLQKRIASSGYCSRRAAEELIVDGKVEVNGAVVTQLGTKVTEKDRIDIFGKRLQFNNETIHLAFNKPSGVVTTRFDPEGGKTVMDLLPKKYQHLKPVGRLDLDSEGLLLFSTDGDLILKLTHPRYEHKKTYEVGVRGQVSDDTVKRLCRGIELDGVMLQGMQTRILKQEGRNTWIEMVLKEGRKRQIRRVMEQFGHTVFAIRRIAIGDLLLGDLKTGDYRLLDQEDIDLALS